MERPSKPRLISCSDLCWPFRAACRGCQWGVPILACPRLQGRAQRIMASGRDYERQFDAMPVQAAPAHVEILVTGRGDRVSRPMVRDHGRAPFLDEVADAGIPRAVQGALDLDGHATLDARDRVRSRRARQMLETATKWTVDAMDLNAGALFHSRAGQGPHGALQHPRSRA